MKKTNKARKGRRLMILGVFLLLIGLGYYSYLSYKVAQYKKEGIKLEKALVSKGNVSPLENKETRDLLVGNAISDEKALGVIRISAIDLILPIYRDTSSQTLLKGAGIVSSTDPPTSKKNTTTALAGHRGSGTGLQYFLHIDQLQAGDSIQITTQKGILHYKVKGKEVIEPDDWSKFIREEGKTTLYLMTCHPYPINNKRLLVKADLVEVEDLRENQ